MYVTHPVVVKSEAVADWMTGLLPQLPEPAATNI